MEFALNLHSSDNELSSILKFPIAGEIRHFVVEKYTQRLEECLFQTDQLPVSTVFDFRT